jgi:hypothetical protein
MRITFTRHPQFGETKIVQKFLLIPRFMYNNCGEESIRWLEYANIEYIYKSGGYDGWPHWKAIQFID